MICRNKIPYKRQTVIQFDEFSPATRKTYRIYGKRLSKKLFDSEIKKMREQLAYHREEARKIEEELNLIENNTKPV